MHKPHLACAGWLRLSPPYFSVNIKEGLAVGALDDVRHDDFPALRFDLYHGIDIHIIEDDQAIAPIQVGVHVAVCFDRFSQAGEI